MEAVIKGRSSDLVQVVGGSLFIALCAQIAIPFGPVPFTLQTFAIFLLAMLQGPRLALFSLMLYLVEITAGFPFKAGGVSNPLCLIGPTGGYYASFPLVAYVSATLFEKDKPITALLAGCGILFTAGVAVLSLFIGLKQAIIWGFLPFIGSEVCKGVALIGIRRRI